MSEKICQHSACSCKAAEGSDFCCEGCKLAHDNQETVCGCDCATCGH